MTDYTQSHYSADAMVSARKAVDVTPSDSATIPPTRALYVGSGGDIKATLSLGGTAVFVGVPSGTILPIQAVRVWSDSTTASDILALY